MGDFIAGVIAFVFIACYWLGMIGLVAFGLHWLFS